MTVEGCAAEPPAAPGTTTDCTIMSGGVQRSYRLHVPAGYHAGEPYPLILAFHGRGETPKLLESYSDLDSLPAIIAYLQGLPGTGGELAWEGTPYAAPGVNDVAFTAEVISAVAQTLPVDPLRVYATGKSDGGGFAALLACTMSGRIAAVAPVAGAFYEQPAPCHPGRAVSVLNFHGTDDTVIPYDGDPSRHLLPVPAWLDGWARLDGCASGPEVFYRQADVIAERWNSCQQGSTVVNYQINGGGHTWPGAQAPSGPGATTQTISATALMGQFFSEHPLPERIADR